MKNIADTIKHLIIINVIMFVATQAKPEVMINIFAAHFPLSPLFKPWQVVTHMFMHGGVMHIAFNMYALWAFGSPLVQIWGKKKFLIFYFVAGLGAIAIYTGIQYFSFSQDMDSLVQVGISRTDVLNALQQNEAPANLMEHLETIRNMGKNYYSVMLGASGAIYGLLVAFAYYFPNAELMLMFIPFPIKAKYFVPLLVLGDIFLGISASHSSPIAHMAHVGGALTGFLLMKTWGKYEHTRWN